MHADEAEAVYRTVMAGNFGEGTDQAVVARAVGMLASAWYRTLTPVEMVGQLGAPDWKGYELRLWEFAEALRFLLNAKRWTGRGPLLDEVARLMGQRELGKGRQTLALLLGEFGGDDHASALGDSLDDPSVWGNVVKALTKAKIAGQSEKVRRVASEGEGWVRKAAQRYLKELRDRV